MSNAIATCARCRKKNRVDGTSLDVRCGFCRKPFDPFDLNVARAYAVAPPLEDDDIDDEDLDGDEDPDDENEDEEAW